MQDEIRMLFLYPVVSDSTLAAFGLEAEEGGGEQDSSWGSWGVWGYEGKAVAARQGGIKPRSFEEGWIKQEIHLHLVRVSTYHSLVGASSGYHRDALACWSAHEFSDAGGR
jgi:hypothetical protein